MAAALSDALEDPAREAEAALLRDDCRYLKVRAPSPVAAGCAASSTRQCTIHSPSVLYRA